MTLMENILTHTLGTQVNIYSYGAHVHCKRIEPSAAVRLIGMFLVLSGPHWSYMEERNTPFQALTK